ncbi:VOC family protein [Deinococcus sonorensis]|uniref:VOC family protein n=2 Tax=Deinococcus sonorensis TaxID=309891 RepID=A0AAU7UBJ8_9DEIO
MQIQAVQLPGRDLGALQAFYRDVLGLTTERSGTRLSVQVGRSRLEFREGEVAGGAHLAFDIPTNQVAEAQHWLEERTALLAEEGQTCFFSEGWNASMVYLLDPEGNVLELIARHTRDNASAAAFGPECLLSISEVGLPVQDVPAATTTLGRALGLTPYLGGSETFQPVGDHHGLLILVREGRPWFPTDTAARLLPTDIQLQAPVPGTLELPGTPYRLTSSPAG